MNARWRGRHMGTGRSIPREIAETIVIAIVVGLFVRTFIVQAFKIPTASMEPNLLVGDHILVNRFVFGPVLSDAERRLLPMRRARRGDVVVFKSTEAPDRDLVKRVIALPGETVEVRGRQVYVDGRPLDEPFASFLHTPAQPSASDERTEVDVRERYGPVIVPAGHLFVMGDSRDNSEDSRSWGFLPERHLKARALVVYWSFAPVGASGDRSPRGWFGGTRWERILRPAR